MSKKCEKFRRADLILKMETAIENRWQVWGSEPAD
jgi:hypothetical protein